MTRTALAQCSQAQIFGVSTRHKTRLTSVLSALLVISPVQGSSLPEGSFQFGAWAGNSLESPQGAVSQDGNRFAYGWMTQMEVADRTSKKVVKLTLSKNGALRSAPEWSPDGRLLAFVDEETLYFYEWGKEKQAKAAQLSRGTHKSILSWSPDGSTLAVQHGTFGAYDISLYNVKTKKLAASDMQDLSGPASHLAWSADSKKLLVGTSAPAIIDGKGRLLFQAGRDIRVKHSYLDSLPSSPQWTIKAALDGAWPEVATSVPPARQRGGSFWSLREDQMAVVAPHGSWIAYQVNDRTLALQLAGQSPKEISEPQVIGGLQVSGGGKWLLCRRSTTFTAIPAGRP